MRGEEWDECDPCPECIREAEVAAMSYAVRRFTEWVATNRAYNGSDHEPGQALYNEGLNAVLGTWAQEWLHEQRGEPDDELVTVRYGEHTYRVLTRPISLEPASDARGSDLTAQDAETGRGHTGDVSGRTEAHRASGDHPGTPEGEGAAR